MKKSITLLLKIVVGVLIAATFLSIVRGIGGGDWQGKPTETELRSANQALVLPDGSHGRNLRFMPKVTFLAVVFDAKLQSNPEQLSAFFLKEAEQKRWRLKVDEQQSNYRLLIFCDGRLAHLMEMTARGSQVQFYGGTYWESNRNSETYCSGENP